MKNRLILFFLILSFTACEKDEEQPIELLKACFGSRPNEINDGEVQFTNCSENATEFHWNFGDGLTSNEEEPLHVFEGDFPYNVTLVVSNSNESDTIVKLIYDDILTEKPNIYIYPNSKIDLCLRINFPLGGNIVKSIPEYTDGWCFNIDTNGIIDNQYNYLFYESKQPNIYQYKKGWCIARSDLKSFFENNMIRYNFSDSEIKDFIEYWIPLLNEDDYYMVYPQTNGIIDEIIQLDFSIEPEHIYRLFYGVVGVDKYCEVEEPKIEAFKRDRFHVVEWGVFRK